MKKLINSLTLIAVVFGFGVAQAQKSVSTAELKTELSKEKLSREQMDKVYDKLSGLIEVKRTNLSMKELLELCLLFFKHDGTDSAMDFVYELKISNPKEFSKTLNQFSDTDKKQIQDFIKMTEEDIKNGNG